MAAKLPSRKQEFVNEYIVSLNATQAAIKAGYSVKTARSQGQRLLTNVDIQEAIQEALKAREQRTLITADYVIKGFKEVAERCMQHSPVMVFDKEAREYVQARDEETGQGVWEFDSGGANKALEMLGKHLGIFADNKSINLNVGVKIIDDIEK
jgi:phage terminase small subunit